MIAAGCDLSTREGGPSLPVWPYRHIRSVVGQTYTAAWAFHAGLSFHWYGRGC